MISRLFYSCVKRSSKECVPLSKYKVVAFEYEGLEFKTSNRLSTSLLNSPLLVVAPFQKVMHAEIESFKKVENAIKGSGYHMSAYGLQTERQIIREHCCNCVCKRAQVS